MKDKTLRAMERFPVIKWADSQLHYFSIVLTKDQRRLFRQNFPPMIKSIESDPRRWHGGVLHLDGKM